MRHLALDRLRCSFDRGGAAAQAQIVLLAQHRSTSLGFQLAPRIAGYRASLPCSIAIGVEALRVMLARDLGGTGFAEHREDQLQAGHVVAKVVAGLHRAQAFEVFVRARSHAKTKFQWRLTCTQVMS